MLYGLNSRMLLYKITEGKLQYAAEFLN
jgi:hypothetical protein